MALNINGTTGISGVDGSASAPALQGSDSNTGINFGSDIVNINTGGSTRATIESNGRLGIGTTSPSTILHCSSSSNTGIFAQSTNSGSSASTNYQTPNRIFYTGIDIGGTNSSYTIYDGTAGAERLKINSSGVMYSPPTYQNTTSNSANMSVPNSDGQFYRSTSSIKYKDNVATLTDTLADKILNCRPVSYTSKCSNDDKTKVFYGLIAEEVDKIDQSLVFYNNDSETSKPEGVQYDRFVPALINLVKRQKTQIETLEARVTALEAA